jgi:hypothetical protein
MQREPVAINLADSENYLSKFQLQLSSTKKRTQASRSQMLKVHKLKISLLKLLYLTGALFLISLPTCLFFQRSLYLRCNIPAVRIT